MIVDLDPQGIFHTRLSAIFQGVFISCFDTKFESSQKRPPGKNKEVILIFQTLRGVICSYFWSLTRKRKKRHLGSSSLCPKSLGNFLLFSKDAFSLMILAKWNNISPSDRFPWNFRGPISLTKPTPFWGKSVVFSVAIIRPSHEGFVRLRHVHSLSQQGWGRSRTRNKKNTENVDNSPGTPNNQFNGCLVISNHFLCKDFESSNWWPTIYKWLALEFQIYIYISNIQPFWMLFGILVPFSSIFLELKKLWNPNLQLPTNHKLRVRFWKFIQVCPRLWLVLLIFGPKLWRTPPKKIMRFSQITSNHSQKNHINFRRFTSQIAPEKKRQTKIAPQRVLFPYLADFLGHLLRWFRDWWWTF